MLVFLVVEGRLKKQRLQSCKHCLGVFFLPEALSMFTARSRYESALVLYAHSRRGIQIEGTLYTLYPLYNSGTRS